MRQEDIEEGRGRCTRVRRLRGGPAVHDRCGEGVTHVKSDRSRALLEGGTSRVFKHTPVWPQALPLEYSLSPSPVYLYKIESYIDYIIIYNIYCI